MSLRLRLPGPPSAWREGSHPPPPTPGPGGTAGGGRAPQGEGHSRQVLLFLVLCPRCWAQQDARLSVLRAGDLQPSLAGPLLAGASSPPCTTFDLRSPRPAGPRLPSRLAPSRACPFQPPGNTSLAEEAFPCSSSASRNVRRMTERSHFVLMTSQQDPDFIRK